MPESSPPAADLASLRGRIDAIDRELLGLLNRRAEVAAAIGALKRAEGSPAFRPEREAAVIDALKASNKGPLPTESVAPTSRRRSARSSAPRARRRFARSAKRR